MTVGAQEDALVCLLSDLIDPTGETPVRDSEDLLIGVEMVELQRRNATSIAADQTLATLLLRQDFLDPLSAASNCLGAALLASWPHLLSRRSRTRSARAVGNDASASFRPCAASSTSRRRKLRGSSKSVALDPVTNRRNTPIKLPLRSPATSPPAPPAARAARESAHRVLRAWPCHSASVRTSCTSSRQWTDPGS